MLRSLPADGFPLERAHLAGLPRKRRHPIAHTPYSCSTTLRSNDRRDYPADALYYLRRKTIEVYVRPSEPLRL